MTLAVFAHAEPGRGLIGGFLIGLGAATLLLGSGRIAGVSGIAARAMRLGHGTMPRISACAFLSGLAAGAAIVAVAGALQPAHFASWPTLGSAGLLVGIGTRMGSGCTSGHGVCGVSRLSARSLAATAVFIAAGVGTVALSKLPV